MRAIISTKSTSAVHHLFRLELFAEHLDVCTETQKLRQRPLGQRKLIPNDIRY